MDEHTDPWGIKVSTVEVKHIDLPQDMQRAMARQAEAERERRAISSATYRPCERSLRRANPPRSFPFPLICLNRFCS